MIETMADPEYLTAEQAAEKLQVHARTVKRLLADGKLPGQKVGSQWRISSEDLRAYMKGDQKPKPEGDLST